MVSAELWGFDDRSWTESIEFAEINLMPSDIPLAAGTPPTAAPTTTSPSSDAADAAQKPRRARTSKPKVKTGCTNCK